MSMKKIVLTVCAAMSVAGCAKPPEGQAVHWKDIGLVGKSMELIHPARLQFFRFGKDHVTATIGSKGPDAAVAGPIFFWGIQENVLLVSKEPVGANPDSASGASELFETFSEPVLAGDALTVTNAAGERVTFSLSE